MEWKKLSSKMIYKNPWIRVREDNILNPSGKRGIYSVVEIPDGVFVIILNDKNEILLIRQQRYCTGIKSWEIPGGGLKQGKTIKSQAKEELLEEARIKIKSLTTLGKTQTQPGVTTQIDHFLLGQGIKFIKNTKNSLSQKDEGIDKVKFFSIDKIVNMIIEGEINHGQTLTAFALFLVRKQKCK